MSQSASTQVREADSLTAALRLNDREFATLRDLIESTLGIQISDAKRLMLETRISRRMRELSLANISAYCERLLNPNTSPLELQHFFDLVTTNKTSFFREPPQLNLAAEDYLPGYLRDAEREQRPLRVWSAACSSGQEVWTLCMLLDRIRKVYAIRADFSVIGSDISSRVLKTAISAKYPSAELADVPVEYHSYLMKSRDPTRNLMRVVPDLRKHAGFFQLNLMSESFGLNEPVDIVFLRNALIYFPRDRQQRIVERVYRNLRPGGLFAVGLTETLHGTGVAARHVGSSLYLKAHTP